MQRQVVHQDVAVPFMQNLCWEEDTLFMIFEEDFRFEPEEEDMESTVVSTSEFQEVVGQYPEDATAPSTGGATQFRVASLSSDGVVAFSNRWCQISTTVCVRDCVPCAEFEFSQISVRGSCWFQT